MNPDLVCVYAILAPLLGAGVIALLGKWPNLRETATLATSAVLIVLVWSLWPTIQAGYTPGVMLAEPLPRLALALKVEPLGQLFAMLASGLWIVTSVYSIGYMRSHHEQNQTRFYCYFAIAIACTLGVAFAANMFTLFIFYEALTLSTFPLVTHAGTPEAKRAGRTYLGLLLGTSIGFLMLAMIITWFVAGTLDFTSGGILRDTLSPPLLGALFALYVFGIGKAALMPFHRWLPAAMVAPTPVSALLHAVAVVKAGVFTILKVSIYLFGIDLLSESGISEWLMYVAAITIVLASLVAMNKDNLKARLAYSTISQLSYIVLGAMLATRASIIGAGMHIVMHALGKITLFFCAGAILVTTHKTEISQMRGLGRTMPITMAAFFIASLSIIGLPPTGGLWSKWYLALGTLEAHQFALLAVLMLSSLLNVVYLLIIPIRGFFAPAVEGEAGIREAPLPALLALVTTSMGCVAMFVYPEPIYRLMTAVIGQ